MAKVTRRQTAKRALPASFSQKSTKSGGGKTVKSSGPKKTGGKTRVPPINMTVGVVLGQGKRTKKK